MNRKQREQNKKNARHLSDNAVVCAECGERGKNWIGYPHSLVDIMAGLPQQGFWTCAKFYDATGRRIQS